MAVSRFYCAVFMFLAVLVYGQDIKKLKTVRIADSCTAGDITYHYNKRGLVNEEIMNKKDSHGVNVAFKATYTYDSERPLRVKHFCNDTLISEELHEYKGDNVVRYRNIVRGITTIDDMYTYRKGRQQKLVTTINGETVVKEFTYNDSLKLKQTTIKTGNIITGIEKEYTNGNTKTAAYYSVPADGQTPSVTVVTVYDFDGNIIDQKTIVKDIETSRTVNHYDGPVLTGHKEFKNGLLTAETLYDLYGNILKDIRYAEHETIIYESKYNKFGDLINVKVIKNGKPQCGKSYTVDYYN